YDAFQTFLSAKKAGDVIKVTVVRDKKEQTFDVKLAPRPGSEPPAGAAIPTLGFQPTAAEGGVGIGAVIPNGPAADAGLQSGDVITAVGGKKVASIEEYRSLIATFKAGDKVKVSVLRGKETKEVEATLAAGGRGPGGGGGGPRPQQTVPGRPYLLDAQVGGQRANVQDDQGKEGFQTGGVFVSKDSGETWTRVNSLNPRPFYFS